MSHQFVYLNYTKGRVGVRIEPNNPERVEAIKAAIPEEDRFYRREAREWCVAPQWLPEILGIVDRFCAGYPIILEEQNADMLITLIEGPQAFTQPQLAKPKGREYIPSVPNRVV